MTWQRMEMVETNEYTFEPIHTYMRFVFLRIRKFLWICSQTLKMVQIFVAREWVNMSFEKPKQLEVQYLDSV